MPNSAADLDNLPVTLVTGYLGSGKTTFINQRLKHAEGMRYAVLVNDFGELNIDAELISTETANTISLTNGCVCCSLADDMNAAMEQVQQISHQLDWVLFEASGVADPARIRTSIEARPGFELKEFLTLVDATRIKALVNDKFVGQHIRRQLQMSAPASSGVADTKVVNYYTQLTKTDLISETELADTRAWLMKFNSTSKHVNDRGASDLSSELPQFFTRVIEHTSPIERYKFEQWLSTLGQEIIRMKGFVYLTESKTDIEVSAYLLQWVSGTWCLEPWPLLDELTMKPSTKTQLVLISTTALDIEL
jgi:G3E family GTPase